MNGWTVPLAPGAVSGGSAVPGCNSPKNQVVRSACISTPSAVVFANPADYATNGLVNDFVEKEFSLDPQTIDTAGSHMLDTWNLTFDLGTGSNLPSYFHYFYENSSYDFSKNCQVYSPGGGGCIFTPHAIGASNLTCLNRGVTCASGWVGDSAQWASETLWSARSLQELWTVMMNDGADLAPGRNRALRFGPDDYRLG